MRVRVLVGGVVAAGMLVVAGWAFGSSGASASKELGRFQPEGPGTLTYQRGKVERGGTGALVTGGLSEAAGSFHPLPPCRIVNTNLTGSGIMAANTTRVFYAVGSGQSQGGATGGCGVPNTATSVLLNVVAASPQGSGNLRLWAYGQDAPNASLVNFTRGVNIANAAPVQLCRDPEASGGLCEFDFAVRASNAATHVVIDVMGYYEGPMMARVFSDGSTAGTSYSVLSVSKLDSTGAYSVEFDRDVTACIATATIDGHGGFFAFEGEVTVAPRFLDPYSIFVATSDSAGNALDRPFSLLVSC